MKKKLSALLAAVMALSLFSGCVKQTPPPADPAPPQPEPEVVEPVPETPVEPEGVTPINFAVLSGPTGVGAAKLLTDIEADSTRMTTPAMRMSGSPESMVGMTES